MINASSKIWCEVFKFMHKDWKLHMICSGETHRWWNQNYLQSRISLSGFCPENIIWPKRIKRSWNKNLQRNDPLLLFFVQLVRIDYGRPTVKVSIADNWQGRGWRFGVALNSRWVLWSFLSQINPISWKLMWILSNIFFESLLNKNKKFHYVWGRFQSGLSIIKSLKMATLNSSREASAAARSNIFYRLIKASPDFIFNGTEWKRALHSDLKIRRRKKN